MVVKRRRDEGTQDEPDPKERAKRQITRKKTGDFGLGRDQGSHQLDPPEVANNPMPQPLSSSPGTQVRDCCHAYYAFEFKKKKNRRVEACTSLDTT